MARAANNVVHVHLGGAGANGDTVVAGGNISMADTNIIRIPNVDAIGVGAITGSHNCQILNYHVVASINKNMDCVAVM